jgi:ribosomal protein L18E
MFRTLGRRVRSFAKKLAKKIKDKVAKAIKKSKKNRAPVASGEYRDATGSKAFRLVFLSALAGGLIASGLAETPVGAPVTAVIGGEIARTTQQIWS